jgi:hypothetical protein
MEFAMRNHISYSVLGVALMAGTSLAHAQTVETVITQPSAPLIVTQRPFVAPPSGVLVTPAPSAVEAVPVQTVETVRTVQSTSAPKRRAASGRVVSGRTGDRVTTTRTIVRQSVVPAPGPAIQAIRQPAYTEVVHGSAYQGLYDVVTPAPALATIPAYPRLYDVATPPAFAAPPVIGPPVVTAAPAYRYFYEPDRILVIDANTGIAVQAIPR